MNITDEKTLLAIINILKKEYPDSVTVLDHGSVLELLVATILSAQCTDERVNMVTPVLFRKYRSAHDYAHAQPDVFEEEIHSTGFFRNKTKSIIGMAQKVVNDYNGEIPGTMEELITLPGVARKTANIILSSCFNKAEGIAVDTHVKRLSGRIGFSDKKDPDKIEEDLMRIVPKDTWMDISYILVTHGRNVCQAKKPKCTECIIKHLCPSAEKV